MNTAPEIQEGDRTTYFTPFELASLWKCSEDVVQSLLRSRKLRGFKVGRLWRITDEARLEYETAEHEPTRYSARRSRKTRIY